jgi:hypothetical protein
MIPKSGGLVVRERRKTGIVTTNSADLGTEPMGETANDEYHLPTSIRRGSAE